jgi:hypothetical protein
MKAVLTSLCLLLATSAQAGIAAATLTSDQANYSTGQTVTITSTGLVGGQLDWIGIVPDGAPPLSYVAYDYVDDVDQMTTFAGLAAGTYVARGFLMNGATEVAVSAPFTIAAAVSTATVTVDFSTYSLGQSVVVHTTGMQAFDWVGIIPVGGAVSSYVAFDYPVTLGNDVTFTNLPLGSYVARGYANNGSVEMAASMPFTITEGIAITPTSTSFVAGDNITFTYNGAPDLPQNWASIAVPGAATNGYIDYLYVTTPTAGSGSFASPGPGTYELRLYSNNSGNLIATSALITVTAPVLTTSITYQAGTNVDFSFAGAPALPTNWVAIAVPGAPANQYLDYQYVATASGSGTFAPIPTGTYELRLFLDNSATLLASTTFTVGTVVAPTATITVDAATFTSGPIGFTFDRTPTTATDWVGIEPVGSPLTTYLDYVYLPTTAAGASSFATAPAPGTYVLRMYSNNSATLLVESAPFVVVSGSGT